MGITQAQAKATSTNAKQTTAPAYTAHRYTTNRHTANFNPAHHSTALIILIFLRFYMLQHAYCNTLTFILPIPKSSREYRRP